MPKVNARTALIQKLTTRINESPVVLASSGETMRNEQFTEGEWLARVEKFIKSDEHKSPNSQAAVEITTALLTKSYANHLPATVVKKLTKPLEPPAPVKVTRITEPKAKAKAVAKVKKVLTGKTK